MNVRLAAMRFVDLRDGFRSQYYDGDRLCDSGFSVVTVIMEIFRPSFVVGERERVVIVRIACRRVVGGVCGGDDGRRA